MHTDDTLAERIGFAVQQDIHYDDAVKKVKTMVGPNKEIWELKHNANTDRLYIVSTIYSKIEDD